MRMRITCEGVAPRACGFIMEDVDADQHFCYDVAVVRGIAASLPDKALRQSDQAAAIDLQKAVQQHSEYTNVRRLMSSYVDSYFE